MPLPAALTTALRSLHLPFEEDAPLARRTWWRVGGPADALVTVSTAGQLAAVQRLARDHGCPLMVLGNGSNVLIADSGVRGIVLRLVDELSQSTAEDDLLKVGGGLRLPVLLARAEKQGWPGLEALAGIPGTVGGAIRMNAGTSLGEIGDLLESVEVVLPDGSIQTLSPADLHLGYRTCVLPPGAIVSSATLRLRGDAAASNELIRTFLERRKATQPLDMPSCGSTFRNPPGDAAGRLIEASGLKGLRIGGAVVSEKHANFLLNTGEATAEDLRALVERVRQLVAERQGVRLHPEVLLAGDWGRPGWDADT
jgi:UDP-N-acetylmuramate dehydrogenase